MKLFYRKLGKGKPLIILHGLFGMSDNWLSIAKRIAQKHTVYILDQRNHGQSPHSPEFNYEILGADLHQFIDEQELSQVRLIGHSLGGKVCMKYALRFPERVEKLVVVDIAPKAYKPSELVGFLKTLLKVDLKKAIDRFDVDRVIESEIPQAAVRQFLLKNLKRNEKNELEWKINLQGIFTNIDGLFEEISALGTYKRDTLFIRGGMSNYINAADYPLIERLFPVAQIITIPLASHWVHSDAPNELCNHLRSFFAN
jgi:pimeloyl-ACP methyl ester carboxylesterase